jgi:general secretion pathway protein M
MRRLNREKYTALGALAVLFLISIAAPTLALISWSQAERELSDDKDLVDRLAAAKRYVGDQTQTPARLAEAPPEAFLKAQTSGLAIAQLEAYFSDIAQESHASVISASAQPVEQSDGADIVRIQVNIDVDYEALQPLLYKLEAGAPYVFVDTLKLRPANLSLNKNATRSSPMKATLGLKAIWRSEAT